MKENKQNLIKRIVPPHTLVSREVKEADLERVKQESKILHNICFLNSGLYKGAVAMHHSQIDNKDPLNFLVTVNNEIFINPKIINHSWRTSISIEGCMSYPEKPMIKVKRWKKITITYQTFLEDGLLSKKIKIKEKGFKSFMLQHEINHGLGILIYPILDPKK